MKLQRWDLPQDEYRRFRIPEDQQAVNKLMAILQSVPPPRSVDVIGHCLRAFRCLRDCFPDGLTSVRLFNALLIGADVVRREPVEKEKWIQSQTFGDVLTLIGPHLSESLGPMEFPRAVHSSHLGVMLDFFNRPEPTTGILLDSDLLIRHASGQLYQEAHLILEKTPQLAFPGLGPAGEPRGSLKRDVRFTPTALARVLAQQVLDTWGVGTSGRLDVLDPACGSGVFLQEILRELQARGFKGQVILRGIDLSEISCTIARFCLEMAKKDAEAAGISVEISISNSNALQQDWGTPDIILMNPPFVSLEAMTVSDRDEVKQELGDLAIGRVDMAMAFMWKAVSSLSSQGVTGSVLPAALLETWAGRKWREALSDSAHVRLIGRFRGYSFFRASLVEPAFLILQSKVNSEQSSTRILLAEEGAEDAAIRGLRRAAKVPPGESEGWEHYEMAPPKASSVSWLPRPRKQLEVIERLSGTMTVVGDLFDVHQGIRTGCNPAFILSSDELETLPESERRFFRAMASNSTIRQGRLKVAEFIFYPYDENGLTIETECDLQSVVPSYYTGRLLQHKDQLQNRPRIPQDKWWRLSEPRSWERSAQPRLVTKYRGRAGSFAYDDKGQFAVVEGHSWFWKGRGCGANNFEDTELPWAYLAILNSFTFESLLACFCPRVQGGQYDLSKLFVDKVFLPNLLAEDYLTSDVVRELSYLGRRIHSGDMPNSRTLDEAVARAYGFSTADFGLFH
ncbi:MAG: N-6 DNA methylase [Armatimonadota bacterium]|nr:N-6 DNA methylase [Armatimonadota bacterium]